MAEVDDDDAALYGDGAAEGKAVGGDVGLGGDAAVAEEALLEDEAAGIKGGEGGGEEEEEDEDDGVDVIIDQEDLQTPGRPTAGGVWGGPAMVLPRPLFHLPYHMLFASARVRQNA
jgi:hypothetical protein